MTGARAFNAIGFTSDCRFYLARATGPMAVELVDGGQRRPIAAAAKLHRRIFHDSGPWLMAELHQVPDMGPAINDDAARACEGLVIGDPDATRGAPR